MAPDPYATDSNDDRIRLIIEPGDDESGSPGRGGGQPHDQRPEDRIDLSRLEEDPDYEFEDEDEPPQRRRLLPAALAVMALAGFLAIVWYAYQDVVGSMGDEAIPLITAGPGPIKSRPAVPGGMEVPHQDRLVLNEIAPDPDKPQVERLLPPPEVPKPPVAQSQQAAPVEAAPATSAAVQGETTGTAEVTQDGSAPAIKLPVPEAPAVPAAVAAPEKAAVPKKIVTATAPAKPAPAVQSAAVPGGFLVQLASLKDKKLVGGEWVRLQKTFPKLLGEKKLVLQEADLGSRGIFFRVRAGYFPNRQSAVALCQVLKAKNQACIVAKR